MVTKKALLVAYLMVLVITPTYIWAQQSSLETTQNSINEAYNAIVKATNAGANTSQLINQLNQAINLTEQSKKIASSNPQQAEISLNQALSLSQNVTRQANAAEQLALSMLPILPVVVAILVIAVGVIVYFFGPKFFWASWLRLRRNYRVNLKKTDNNQAGFIVTFEQVCAIFLGVTIIIAAFSVSGLFISRQGEPFSELGVLGPNMQLGNYPSEIVVGQTVHFTGYVGNHMGQPQYYTFMVKLGNNDTQVNPAGVASIHEYSQVLANNQTWAFPIDITLTKVGVNQRIIFELWFYNTTTQQTQYHQRWGQIWLNVIAPAS
jgi:uncharacterized membrane protein